MSKEKLKLSDIRKELPFTLHTGMTFSSVHSFLKEKLDFDVWLPTKEKKLQRPFCWTLEQEQNLIVSILKGIKIEGFCIIRIKSDDPERDGVIEIIDGKQRLGAIRNFINGEFALTSGHFFEDLEQDAQFAILHMQIKGNDTYSYELSRLSNHFQVISDDDKIMWFRMINFAGTPQDEAHLQYLLEDKK